MQLKDFIRLTCAFSAISAASPVLAQEGSVKPSAGIGDVVVTAQKRATNVQDTPIAITAVSQDAMARQGVYQITDITRVAPEIKVLVVANAYNTLQIRGLRTGQSGNTVDSPNAVHLDGNYLARMAGLNGYFYDLERVEVLAGPQGTLYGRNSVGGTLNMITHKPELGKFEGAASVDIGNYNQMVLNGAVNLPVTDDLAIRVAGMRNTRDGFFTDTNGGSVDLQGYRVSTKWQATQSDTITITGDYQRDQTGGFGAVAPVTKVYRSPNISSSTAAASLGSASIVNFGSTCNTSNNCTTVPINATDDIWHNRVSTSNDYANSKVETDGYAAQWDHDLGFATLTAQASYRTMDLTQKTGQLAGGQQDPRLRAANVIGGSPVIADVAAHSEWNTHEIRLVSNDAHQTAIKYTAGINHFDEKVFGFNADNYAAWYANNSTARPGAQIGSLVFPSGPDGLPVHTGGSNASTVWTDAFAVFGEATYTPSAWSALHLTLGARYNWEEKHGISESTAQSVAGRSYNYYPYPASGEVVCPATTASVLCPGFVLQYTKYDETREFERATYKGGIQYDLTDANMVYGTYSTGFVSGGFAFGVPQSGDLVSGVHSYNPMIIESYEVGSKNRFFDNRLQVNVSAYHYDFTNYLANQALRIVDKQAQNFRTAYITAANAGDTEFQGATFDMQFLLTDDDAFHMNGQFTEANIKFNLADLYFKSTQAYLQSQGFESTTACTLAALTGSLTGAATTSGAVNCPLLQSYLGGVVQLYPGNAYPADFNPEGSFERPKWNLNADYTHTFHLPDATLDAQVAWHYESRGVAGNGIITPPVNINRVVPAGFTNSFDLVSFMPQKDTWDLSFRYQRESASWSITAYVRNLLDAENLNARTINTNVQGATSWNFDTLQAANADGQVINVGSSTLNYLYLTESYDPPRTFGVQFQAKF